MDYIWIICTVLLVISFGILSKSYIDFLAAFDNRVKWSEELFKYHTEYLENFRDDLNRRIEIYNESYHRILDEENRIFSEWQKMIDAQKTEPATEEKEDNAR